MAVAAPEQMSPQMRQRYGLDRNPWPIRIVAVLVVLGYAAALVFFAVRLTEQPVRTAILVWQQPQPDRVDITFEVNKPAGLALTCAIRTQDPDRVDIGYATTDIEAAPGYVQQTYPMRLLGPAMYVEILGCGPTGEPLRVPPPAFPPGVAAPQQPWSATG